MSLSLGFLDGKVLFCLCVILFQHHFTFSSTSNPSGLTLRAVLDDSPDSPLCLIENLTKTERVRRLIKVTNARAKYLNLVSNPNASVVLPDNIRLPMYREGLYYAVGFRIGSQRHPVKLLLDTGGGLTWTQCQPCRNCFPQHLPIYDRRMSTSYTTLPCSHPLCNGEYRRYGCVHNVCVYNVGYGGGASTRGIASYEAFHFYVDRYHTQTFNNVVFGCSYDNRDVFFQNSELSGIFGLSLTRDSMSVQFGRFVHYRFSYCLVPFSDAVPRPLVLSFGEDVPQLPRPQTTMFLQPPDRQYYFYLELLDISVGNHRIGFAPYTFQPRPNRHGGFFIDSGALYTVLDTDTPGVNAYEEVLLVFEAYYGSRSLRRVQGDFEYCFEHPNGYNDFASLTFHFNGADYTVDGRYMHTFEPDHFCVAIIGSNYASVLGAWQQQNKRIIYDGGIGGLQFADEQCINDVH